MIDMTEASQSGLPGVALEAACMDVVIRALSRNFSAVHNFSLTPGVRAVAKADLDRHKGGKLSSAGISRPNGGNRDSFVRWKAITSPEDRWRPVRSDSSWSLAAQASKSS